MDQQRRISNRVRRIAGIPPEKQLTKKNRTTPTLSTSSSSGSQSQLRGRSGVSLAGPLVGRWRLGIGARNWKREKKKRSRMNTRAVGY